ncbi:MAG: (d)CMP kinase [Candidatus Omnitrophota bacterium]
MYKSYSRKTSLSLRTIAGLIAFVFLLTDGSVSSLQAYSAGSSVSNVQGGRLSQDLHDPAQSLEIQAPPEHGFIETRHRETIENRGLGTGHQGGQQKKGGPGSDFPISDSRQSKTIIYIQDAHDSLEAQKNIASLIRYYVEKHGVRTVFEEGYSGEVPTDRYFAGMADAAVREKVAFHFLDKLRIGGAEYAHITRTQDFRLVGADNISDHKANIRWCQRNAKYQKETASDLKELLGAIRALADKHFPKDLRSWVRLKERFAAGELSLLDYLKRMHVIIAALDPAGEISARYPAVSLLLLAEKTVDPVTQKKLETIDSAAVYREIETIENELAERWTRDPTARKIFDYYRALTLIERLSRIQVTQAEFVIAKGFLTRIRTEDIADFIVRESKTNVVLSRLWETLIRDAVMFYETAESRDRAVEKAIDGFLAAPGEDTAVLVFGGFHANNIKDILKRKGLDYVVVTPKITEKDTRHEAYYHRLMSVGYHDFEVPLYVRRAARAESRFMQIESNPSLEPTFRDEIRDLAETTFQANKPVRAETREGIALEIVGEWIGDREALRTNLENRLRSRLTPAEMKRIKKIVLYPHQGDPELRLLGQTLAFKTDKSNPDAIASQFQQHLKRDRVPKQLQTQKITRRAFKILGTMAGVSGVVTLGLRQYQISSKRSLTARTGKFHLVFTGHYQAVDFEKLRPVLDRIVRQSWRNPARGDLPEVFLLQEGLISPQELRDYLPQALQVLSYEKLMEPRWRDTLEKAYTEVSRLKTQRRLQDDQMTVAERKAAARHLIQFGTISESVRPFFVPYLEWQAENGVRVRWEEPGFETWYRYMQENLRNRYRQSFFEGKAEEFLRESERFARMMAEVTVARDKAARELAGKILAENPRANVIYPLGSAHTFDQALLTEGLRAEVEWTEGEQSDDLQRMGFTGLIQREYAQGDPGGSEAQRELLAKAALESLIQRLRPGDQLFHRFIGIIENIFKRAAAEGYSARQAVSKLCSDVAKRPPIQGHRLGDEINLLETLRKTGWLSEDEYREFASSLRAEVRQNMTRRALVKGGFAAFALAMAGPLAALAEVSAPLAKPKDPEFEKKMDAFLSGIFSRFMIATYNGEAGERNEMKRDLIDRAKRIDPAFGAIIEKIATDNDPYVNFKRIEEYKKVQGFEDELNAYLHGRGYHAEYVNGLPQGASGGTGESVRRSFCFFIFKVDSHETFQIADSTTGELFLERKIVLLKKVMDVGGSLQRRGFHLKKDGQEMQILFMDSAEKEAKEIMRKAWDPFVSLASLELGLHEVAETDTVDEMKWYVEFLLKEYPSYLQDSEKQTLADFVKKLETLSALIKDFTEQGENKKTEIHLDLLGWSSIGDRDLEQQFRLVTEEGRKVYAGLRETPAWKAFDHPALRQQALLFREVIGRIRQEMDTSLGEISRRFAQSDLEEAFMDSKQDLDAARQMTIALAAEDEINDLLEEIQVTAIPGAVRTREAVHPLSDDEVEGLVRHYQERQKETGIIIRDFETRLRTANRLWRENYLGYRGAYDAAKEAYQRVKARVSRILLTSTGLHEFSHAFDAAWNEKTKAADFDSWFGAGEARAFAFSFAHYRPLIRTRFVRDMLRLMQASDGVHRAGMALIHDFKLGRVKASQPLTSFSQPIIPEANRRAIPPSEMASFLAPFETSDAVQRSALDFLGSEMSGSPKKRSINKVTVTHENGKLEWQSGPRAEVRVDEKTSMKNSFRSEESERLDATVLIKDLVLRSVWAVAVLSALISLPHFAVPGFLRAFIEVFLYAAVVSVSAVLLRSTRASYAFRASGLLFSIVAINIAYAAFSRGGFSQDLWDWKIYALRAASVFAGVLISKILGDHAVRQKMLKTVGSKKALRAYGLQARWPENLKASLKWSLVSAIASAPFLYGIYIPFLSEYVRPEHLASISPISQYPWVVKNIFDLSLGTFFIVNVLCLTLQATFGEDQDILKKSKELWRSFLAIFPANFVFWFLWNGFLWVHFSSDLILFSTLHALGIAIWTGVVQHFFRIFFKMDASVRSAETDPAPAGRAEVRTQDKSHRIHKKAGKGRSRSAAQVSRKGPSSSEQHAQTASTRRRFLALALAGAGAGLGMWMIHDRGNARFREFEEIYLRMPRIKRISRMVFYRTPLYYPDREWEGRRLLAIGDVHTHPESLERILGAAREILKDPPGQWIFLTEGYEEWKQGKLGNAPDIALIEELARRAGAPMYDLIAKDTEQESVDLLAERLGYLKEEIYDQILFLGLGLQLAYASQTGRSPQWALASELDILTRRTGLSAEYFQGRLYQLISRLKAMNDSGLAAFLKKMNRIELMKYETLNIISAKRTKEVLQANADRKKVFAFAGFLHLPVYGVQAPKGYQPQEMPYNFFKSTLPGYYQLLPYLQKSANDGSVSSEKRSEVRTAEGLRASDFIFPSFDPRLAGAFDLRWDFDDTVYRIWDRLIVGDDDPVRAVLPDSRLGIHQELAAHLMIDPSAVSRYLDVNGSWGLSRGIFEDLRTQLRRVHADVLGDWTYEIRYVIENVVQHVLSHEGGRGLILVFMSRSRVTQKPVLSLYVVDSGRGMPLEKVLWGGFRGRGTKHGTALRSLTSDLVSVPWEFDSLGRMAFLGPDGEVLIVHAPREMPTTGALFKMRNHANQVSLRMRRAEMRNTLPFVEGQIHDRKVIDQERAISAEQVTAAVDLDNTITYLDKRWQYVLRKGILGQLEILRKAGLRLVLWTYSNRLYVEEFMRQHPALASYFDRIITRENYDIGARDEDVERVLRGYRWVDHTVRRKAVEDYYYAHNYTPKDIGLLGYAVLIDNAPVYKELQPPLGPNRFYQVESFSRTERAWSWRTARIAKDVLKLLRPIMQKNVRRAEMRVETSRRSFMRMAVGFLAGGPNALGTLVEKMASNPALSIAQQLLRDHSVVLYGFCSSGKIVDTIALAASKGIPVIRFALNETRFFFSEAGALGRKGSPLRETAKGARIEPRRISAGGPRASQTSPATTPPSLGLPVDSGSRPLSNKRVISINRNPLRHTVITIDGPAASGKGTVARAAAQQLGFIHVDLGTLYRALAEKAVSVGMDLRDPEAIRGLVQSTVIDLKREGAGMRVYRDGVDVTTRLRTPEVSRATPIVAEHFEVNQYIFQQAREIGEGHDIVIEGRNAGTDIFPEKEVIKFYLTARMDVRGKRRFRDYQQTHPEMTLEEVIRDLEMRDRQDSEREIAPLRKAPDAVEIDNSDLSAAETLAVMRRVIETRIREKSEGRAELRSGTPDDPSGVGRGWDQYAYYRALSRSDHPGSREDAASTLENHLEELAPGQLAEVIDFYLAALDRETNWAVRLSMVGLLVSSLPLTDRTEQPVRDLLRTGSAEEKRWIQSRFFHFPELLDALKRPMLEVCDLLFAESSAVAGDTLKMMGLLIARGELSREELLGARPDLARRIDELRALAPSDVLVRNGFIAYDEARPGQPFRFTPDLDGLMMLFDDNMDQIARNNVRLDPAGLAELIERIRQERETPLGLLQSYFGSGTRLISLEWTAGGEPAVLALADVLKFFEQRQATHLALPINRAFQDRFWKAFVEEDLVFEAVNAALDEVRKDRNIDPNGIFQQVFERRLGTFESLGLDLLVGGNILLEEGDEEALFSLRDLLRKLGRERVIFYGEGSRAHGEDLYTQQAALQMRDFVQKDPQAKIVMLGGEDKSSKLGRELLAAMPGRVVFVMETDLDLLEGCRSELVPIFGRYGIAGDFGFRIRGTPWERSIFSILDNKTFGQITDAVIFHSEDSDDDGGDSPEEEPVPVDDPFLALTPDRAELRAKGPEDQFMPRAVLAVLVINLVVGAFMVLPELLKKPANVPEAEPLRRPRTPAGEVVRGDASEPVSKPARSSVWDRLGELSLEELADLYYPILDEMKRLFSDLADLGDKDPARILERYRICFDFFEKVIRELKQREVRFEDEQRNAFENAIEQFLFAFARFGDKDRTVRSASLMEGFSVGHASESLADMVARAIYQGVTGEGPKWASDLVDLFELFRSFNEGHPGLASGTILETHLTKYFGLRAMQGPSAKPGEVTSDVVGFQIYDDGSRPAETRTIVIPDTVDRFAEGQRNFLGNLKPEDLPGLIQRGAFSEEEAILLRTLVSPEGAGNLPANASERVRRLVKWLQEIPFDDDGKAPGKPRSEVRSWQAMAQRWDALNQEYRDILDRIKIEDGPMRNFALAHKLQEYAEKTHDLSKELLEGWMEEKVSGDDLAASEELTATIERTRGTVDLLRRIRDQVLELYLRSSAEKLFDTLILLRDFPIGPDPVSFQLISAINHWDAAVSAEKRKGKTRVLPRPVGEDRVHLVYVGRLNGRNVLTPGKELFTKGLLQLVEFNEKEKTQVRHKGFHQSRLALTGSSGLGIPAPFRFLNSLWISDHLGENHFQVGETEPLKWGLLGLSKDGGMVYFFEEETHVVVAISLITWPNPLNKGETFLDSIMDQVKRVPGSLDASGQRVNPNIFKALSLATAEVNHARQADAASIIEPLSVEAAKGAVQQAWEDLKKLEKEQGASENRAELRMKDREGYRIFILTRNFFEKSPPHLGHLLPALSIPEVTLVQKYASDSIPLPTVLRKIGIDLEAFLRWVLDHYRDEREHMENMAAGDQVRRVLAHAKMEPEIIAPISEERLADLTIDQAANYFALQGLGSLLRLMILAFPERAERLRKRFPVLTQNANDVNRDIHRWLREFPEITEKIFAGRQDQAGRFWLRMLHLWLEGDRPMTYRMIATTIRQRLQLLTFLLNGKMAQEHREMLRDMLASRASVPEMFASFPLADIQKMLSWIPGAEPAFIDTMDEPTARSTMVLIQAYLARFREVVRRFPGLRRPSDELAADYLGHRLKIWKQALRLGEPDVPPTIEKEIEKVVAGVHYAGRAGEYERERFMEAHRHDPDRFFIIAYLDQYYGRSRDGLSPPRAEVRVAPSFDEPLSKVLRLRQEIQKKNPGGNIMISAETVPWLGAELLAMIRAFKNQGTKLILTGDAAKVPAELRAYFQGSAKDTDEALVRFGAQRNNVLIEVRGNRPLPRAGRKRYKRLLIRPGEPLEALSSLLLLQADGPSLYFLQDAEGDYSLRDSLSEILDLFRRQTVVRIAA